MCKRKKIELIPKTEDRNTEINIDIHANIEIKYFCDRKETFHNKKRESKDLGSD